MSVCANTTKEIMNFLLLARTSLLSSEYGMAFHQRFMIQWTIRYSLFVSYLWDETVDETTRTGMKMANCD